VKLKWYFENCCENVLLVVPPDSVFNMRPKSMTKLL